MVKISLDSPVQPALAWTWDQADIGENFQPPDARRRLEQAAFGRAHRQSSMSHDGGPFHLPRFGVQAGRHVYRDNGQI